MNHYWLVGIHIYDNTCTYVCTYQLYRGPRQYTSNEQNILIKTFINYNII